MKFVMCMTRQASAGDDRTSQILLWESDPRSEGYEVGGVWSDDDGLTWAIEDIFPDDEGRAA